MPAIDLMPNYEAKLPKSPHDLSHSLGFTCTCAHLLPVFHDILQPGDHVKLGFEFQLRTMPLQSAAMEKFDVHTEYFFVPFPLLYSPFGNTFYDIEDNYSSNFSQSLGLRNGNFPLLDFSSLYNDITENYNVKPYAQNSQNIGEMLAKMAYRLLDMLGYQLPGTTGYYEPNSFPWPLLAYHCIYQYYYRLDSREKFNQTYFNWDRFYNTALVETNTAELMKIHYRPKSSDYFTDVKVSPIVDVLNLENKQLLPTVNDWLTRDKVGSNKVLNSGYVGNTSSWGNGSPNSVSNSPSSAIQTNFGFLGVNIRSENVTPSNGLDINTANIRALFANEKLWSVTGRAKKHYDDQTLAHFGFKVPHDVKHEISCFGHDRSVINIGEVISTASTADAPLGEIAGKGYAAQSINLHEFTAPCHGVVMVIFSVTPRYRYQNTLLKINNLASRTDLPIPEYDHLGMQPIFRYEGQRAVGAANAGDVMGWQYRYEQYKRRFNRVTQIFSGLAGQQGSLTSWMNHFNPWPTGMPNTANTPSYVDYLYLPTDANNIMLAAYSNDIPTEGETPQINADTVYGTDPFVVDSHITCKKLSWMSDFSLPRLDA